MEIAGLLNTELKPVEMDLIVEIDTENQQQIQLKVIHDKTNVSTTKNTRSFVLSNRSGKQVYGINENSSNWILCLNIRGQRKYGIAQKPI